MFLCKQRSCRELPPPLVSTTGNDHMKFHIWSRLLLVPKLTQKSFSCDVHSTIVASAVGFWSCPENKSKIVFKRCIFKRHWDGLNKELVSKLYTWRLYKRSLLTIVKWITYNWALSIVAKHVRTDKTKLKTTWQSVFMVVQKWKKSISNNVRQRELNVLTMSLLHLWQFGVYWSIDVPKGSNI